MIITDVRIKKVTGDNNMRLKAYVDLVFDECLAVHGLKLIEGDTGKFLAMPSRKMVNGEFKDIVHPIQSEFRKQITEKVIDEYEKLDLEKIDTGE